MASLSARLTVLLGLAAAVILTAMALLVDHQVDQELRRRFDDSLLLQAQALASMAQLEAGQLRLGRSRADAPLLAAVRPHARYRLRCGDRQVAQPAGAIAWPVPRPRPAQPQFTDHRLADGDPGRGVTLSFGLGGNDDDGDVDGASLPCTLALYESRTPLEGTLLALDGILLLVPALALVLLLAAVPWLTRRGLRPLARLAESMRDVGPATPQARLPTPPVRELQPLAQRFNEVLARMDEGLARERQFAGGLAHETRTRLAELRSLIEVERRFPGRSSAAIFEEIGAIGSELEATVNALLHLTRLESGLEPLQPRCCALARCVRRQLQQHEETLLQRRLQVVERLDASAAVQADPALLDLVVANLLGNAAAYAPPGSEVHVDADADGIRVANPAPELVPADLAALGERFWRKQHDAEHHAGLGLTLAQAAAQALGMRLHFQLDRQQWLRARLQWPAAKNRRADRHPLG